MDFRGAIGAQYLAALTMLERAIEACPAALWQRAGDPNQFWQVAYHALFFTHLYLQDSEQTVHPWPGHREEYRFEVEAGAGAAEVAPKATVLEFLAFCRRQVAEKLPTMDLDAASGFDWLPFTKFELQLYSLRHIQQHVGELLERLGPAASAIGWVGTVQPASAEAGARPA